MGTTFKTREEWLEAAVIRVTRLFKPLEPLFPDPFPTVRVSVGWPSKGGTSNKNKVIGECWKTAVATDGVSQIFISPTHGAETISVLATLVHEMIHAWDDCESNHQGRFAKAAKMIGLQGRMTATYVDSDTELGRQLLAVIQQIGPFPHAALVLDEMDKQRPKQSTRMIKLVANGCCDYVVRTTRKWIDEGLPKCPHDTEMEEATP